MGPSLTTFIRRSSSHQHGDYLINGQTQDALERIINTTRIRYGMVFHNLKQNVRCREKCFVICVELGEWSLDVLSPCVASVIVVKWKNLTGVVICIVPNCGNNCVLVHIFFSFSQGALKSLSVSFMMKTQTHLVIRFYFLLRLG